MPLFGQEIDFKRNMASICEFSMSKDIALNKL